MSSQTSKKNLIAMCKLLGIKINTSKTKEQLKNLIKNYETSKKVSIVSADQGDIKYIYHLADIHIRSLERHAEYAQVFNRLYDYLKSQENLNESVLVIAGDVFHSKDKLVPESIAVFNGLVTNLTSILPVCMIAGNHDAFASSNRVDVISGITDIKKFHNLHFFKNSGIYKYNNINFVVSSIIDDIFTEAPDLSEHSRNIGLYHGVVSNSKTDSGTSLTSIITTQDFKNLDIVMLGDIHKRQFLTPTIAYCGSLVQQNHGENLTEHGLIKWNIIEKTSECVNIKNDYGYITVSPESIETTLFPKNSRVRVRHPYDYNLDIEKVKDELSKHTTVLSISKEILQDYCSYKSNEEETPERCEESLLETLLLSKFDTATKQKILDLHSKLKQEHCEKTNLEILPWSINYIEFKNIFIYGGDVLNKVNLLPGITGIVGSNASGKTSLLNIIIYALFGNVFKTKNFSNRNIINRNSKNFYLKMSISLAGEELLIEKEGKVKTRGIFTGMDETLSFSKITQKGEVELLNCANKLDTMKKIFDTLGLTTKENFILTNVVSYSNYVSLLNHSSADISKTFSQLFDIQVYKNIHSDVVKKYKTLSITNTANIEKIKKYTEDSVNTSESTEDLQDKLQEAKTELEAINLQLENILTNSEYEEKAEVTEVEVPNVKKRDFAADLKSVEIQDSFALVPKALFLDLKAHFSTTTLSPPSSKVRRKIIVKNEARDFEISVLKQKRSGQTSKLMEISSSLTRAKIREEASRIAKEKLKNLQIQNEELQNEMVIIGYYKDTIAVLPKVILADKIKKIEMECNVLCYRLIGLTINLDTYSESDTPETKYEITAKKASGSIIGIDQISGFERFVVNVALKLALDKYKCQSGAKIFCIDEAFDCISVENFDKIDELFLYLKRYYQTVLVVSHNDELKKKIDKSISITVGDTFSSIAST